MLLDLVNQRLHPGTQCPGAGALGECAAMFHARNADEIEPGAAYWDAEIYLYPNADHIDGRTLVGWFLELGCSEVVVQHVLDDADNGFRDGRGLDGERWMRVTFVAPAGLMESTEPQVAIGGIKLSPADARTNTGWREATVEKLMQLADEYAHRAAVADAEPESAGLGPTTAVMAEDAARSELEDSLRDAISVAPSAAPMETAVPSGHALVPIEPTPAMFAVDAPEDERPGDVGTMKYRRGIWSAMVRAAGNSAHNVPAARRWPAGLLDRIKAAEQRINNNHAPRRIPADPHGGDVDLVLAEVRYLIEGRWPPFWINDTAATPSANDRRNGDG